MLYQILGIGQSEIDLRNHDPARIIITNDILLSPFGKKAGKLLILDIRT
jgi:hypothetical protein